ncbi:MAG TPA: glycerol-3-phosphate dehydrogenase/oxidase [Bryobacteraceae bacterium]|nr:glycerol-3-phosphate dehydrogenase/oxidase [Bryobacteraceae bacterium]
MIERGTRRRNIERLGAEAFDILIVGGGINGAGVARDLALRARMANSPLKVGLLEKGHFASGTSGRNSQLIHGGLRYLKYFEFHLVREALRERAILLDIAPHLVKPLGFLMPIASNWERVYYGSGLWLYDTFAGKQNIERHKRLSREEMAQMEPGLASDTYAGGALFYDCRVHSARLVLENIAEAIGNGVAAANYVREVERKRANDGIWSVTLEDTLTDTRFETKARKLIDATGPWSHQGVRLVRGSHVILPRITAGDHAIAYFEPSGRIVFLIPWGSEPELTLVGTTEVDHTGDADHVHISPEEMSYLLGIARKLFPAAAGVEPVATYSALRPLIQQGTDSPTTVSREHRIWNTEDGVLHITGGKYTTYRLMSEEASDLALTELAPELATHHPTALTPLNGNTRERIDQLLASKEEFAKRFQINGHEAENAIQDYGVAAEKLFAYLPQSAPAGLSRLKAAQLHYAVEHEMAQRLDDFLHVSTYLGYQRHWDAEALAPLEREIRRLLGDTVLRRAKS